MGDVEKDTTNKLWSHVTINSYVVAELLGVIGSFLWAKVWEGLPNSWYSIVFWIVVGIIGGLLLIHPLLLTVFNMIFWLVPALHEKFSEQSIQLEEITIIEGVIYNLIFSYYLAGFWLILIEEELASAKWCLIFIVPVLYFSVKGIGAYARIRKKKEDGLSATQRKKAIGALFGGIVMCVLWVALMIYEIYTCKGLWFLFFYMGLLPLNCALIAGKVIREQKRLLFTSAA